MRILVTGISGQVGGALVSQLAGHDVIACERAALDLARPERIAPLLDRAAPELIINPAAYTAVDRAEDEPELAMRVNGQAPGELARWAAARDVPLIHFSTDYVFGGSGSRPWREDDATGPLSVYGRSKLAGEQAVRSAGGSVLIIRTSWVYAATGTNFLRTVARLARERTELRIVADQIGAPTPAAAIAKAVGLMLDGGLEAFRSRCREAQGIVHLAASGETNWCEFARAIVAGLASRGVTLAATKVHPIRSDEYPTRAKRPMNSRLDLSRLQRVFGIQPANWRAEFDPELDLLAEEIR